MPTTWSSGGCWCLDWSVPPSRSGRRHPMDQSPCREGRTQFGRGQQKHKLTRREPHAKNGEAYCSSPERRNATAALRPLRPKQAAIREMVRAELRTPVFSNLYNSGHIVNDSAVKAAQFVVESRVLSR